MKHPQQQAVSNPAQTYEDYLVPHQFRPWTEELLDRAKPQPGARVLDVACGTGIVARMVAQQLGGGVHVTGLDISPAMLEVARSMAEREGVKISWHEGSAELLPFPDASFDLVLVQQGLQFFKDKAAATREVHRVLAPDGRAATATWAELARNPFYVPFAASIERHLGTAAMQTPFSLGDPEMLRSLFVDAGFGEIDVELVTRTVRFPAPERFLELLVAGAAAAVPALQAMDATARAALIEAVRADMAAPVRQYTDGDELVLAQEVYVVIAQKKE